MKYLLIAMIIDASGDASALYPSSWYDEEAACEARGEEFRSAMLAQTERDVEAVYFDCQRLTPLEIIVMSDMMPYKMPHLPESLFQPCN